ncbi:MAG: GHKL domain-containing protein, partial [Armatimonadetes bacterium]|nr:GHKL domain-containing protein [Armatimonadota bacterium]
RQRGVYVSVDIPESITLRADRLQILQVLQNLVDNAVKYTGSGGTIGIKAFQSENEVTLKVQDTGIGIPPGDLDRIFERFYRVDKARSRQLGGTGLGLSIVKDIVDLYDGRIVVESEVGKGSTFTVVLPKYPPDSVS